MQPPIFPLQTWNRTTDLRDGRECVNSNITTAPGWLEIGIFSDFCLTLLSTNDIGHVTIGNRGDDGNKYRLEGQDSVLKMIRH